MIETSFEHAPLRQIRLRFAVAALCVFAIPLTAKLMSAEFGWSLDDFVVFAAMLALLGGAIELVCRYASGRMLRAGGIAFAIMGFLSVWAVLAVGFD